MSKFAPVLAAVAALGIVGGVAAAQAFQPTAKPAQVQLAQPAAQVVTAEPTVTASAAPKPVVRKAVVKPAPKPVATVNSVAPAPRPAPVQKEIVVADPTPAQPTPQGPPPMIKKRDDVVPEVLATQGPVVIGDPNAPVPPMTKK